MRLLAKAIDGGGRMSRFIMPQDEQKTQIEFFGGGPVDGLTTWERLGKPHGGHLDFVFRYNGVMHVYRSYLPYTERLGRFTAEFICSVAEEES